MITRCCMNNNSSSLTYQQWLEKYFTSTTPIPSYRRKDGNGYITEAQAKEYYNRTHKS